MTRPLDDGEELAFRDRTLRGPAPARPQPLRHGLLGRGAADPDRRRPPDRPHLLQPADLPPARRLRASAPQALVTYIESLQKTRELPAEIVLSGHGEPITDHVALIDERLAKHERRKEKIYGLIAEQPRTGYELAQAIWGNVAVTQAFLTLSEVIGHVDLLVNEGAGARGRRGDRGER